MRLVLASASPRRSALLAAAGFAFDISPVEVDETPLADEEPRDYVSRLARLKAECCPGAADDAVVLAADTTVVVEREILAKPIDDDDARRMLRLLSGRDHEVLTGVALRHRRHAAVAVERTTVRFLPLSEADIDWYVTSGEPADKAGAYGAQGLASRFIDRVEGSHANVVGLPVCRVYVMLRQLLGEEGLSRLATIPSARA